MAYSAELYVHDLDRQAADALNQFPKFVKLLESYSANYDEKAATVMKVTMKPSANCSSTSSVSCKSTKLFFWKWKAAS